MLFIAIWLLGECVDLDFVCKINLSIPLMNKLMSLVVDDIKKLWTQKTTICDSSRLHKITLVDMDLTPSSKMRKV